MTECLYLKKPVLSVAHSIENAHGSSLLSKRSPACIDLGYFKDIEREALIHAIEKYQEPSKEIMDWLNEGLIDGKGAKRVKQWIKEKDCLMLKICIIESHQSPFIENCLESLRLNTQIPFDLELFQEGKAEKAL